MCGLSLSSVRPILGLKANNIVSFLGYILCLSPVDFLYVKSRIKELQVYKLGSGFKAVSAKRGQLSRSSSEVRTPNPQVAIRCPDHQTR